MNNKSKTIYVCSDCGEEYARWQGKCESCTSWNTIKEFKTALKNSSSREKAQAVEPIFLNDIQTKEEDRISTGSSEFDESLSGGLVTGSITLLGGDPGIGKSTLMLQVAHSVSNSLYISGEESLSQISIRAKRLNLDLKRIKVVSETNVGNIIATIEKSKPRLVIIDSIQTLLDETYPSTPGSLVQVRECSLLLAKTAKTLDIPIIIVGHVTKEGNVAGPKTLEHLVDTVCYLEGKKYESIRIVRTVKHRFGSTNEIGIFEMTDSGLKSLANPSAHFINQKSLNNPGTALAVIIDGNKPFIIEVQALTTKTSSPYPKRLASGIDSKRLDIIVAILENIADIETYKYDIFINITGGITIKDMSVDLAVAICIISSLKKWKVPDKWCYFGELGLAGEIRTTSNEEIKIKEAKRLGYLPITEIDSLQDAIQMLKSSQIQNNGK